MAIFQYEAVSEGGKKEIGMVNADSFELAKDKLRSKNIYVTKLQDYIAKSAEVSLPPAILLGFTRDLSLLLKASLPLYECLLTIEEKYRDHKSHSLFLEICDQIKHGKSLSFVLSQFPKSFDQVYISMVKAGEEMGCIEKVFDELFTLISRGHVLRKKLTSAMIYPAFLGGFCLLIIAALFFFLIPSMQELFEGKNLHPMTEIVLSISRFLSENSLSLLTLFLGGGILVFFGLRSPSGKKSFKGLLLKLPIVSKMIKETILVRFSRVFSTLLQSGVPMVEALRLSKKVMHHPLFEKVVEEAETKIIEGKKLSSELKKSPLFPNLYIRMLSVAEEAGNMPVMLKHIASIYEEDLEKSLSRITTLLQPIMLLILGIVVGTIVLSVLLPLTDVSSFVD